MTEAFSLLSGPDPAAATDRAFTWADETAGSGPDSVLCLTQSRERADELERRWRDDRDPLRFTATTLDDYVARLYERATGSLSRSKLAKPDRLRLVEAAIERYGPDDGPFADVEQPSNDLVDHVQGLFSLLEYAGYATPDDVEHALRCAGVDGSEGLAPTLFASFRDAEPGSEVSELATQASSITGLYAEFQRLRREIHPDWTADTPEQYLRLLDDELLVETLPPSVDAVVLDGLTRLAPAEREAVARIARNRPTVAVVPLVHDSLSGDGVDLGVARALDVYWAIGFELDYEVPDRVDENRLDAVRSLHVPSYDASTVEAAEVGLEWLEPATEREEVRTVARRVRALLDRDAVAPSDVGVVVTDRTTYRGIVSETLLSYEIPFTFTNETGIEQTLVGDAVEALVDLADEEPRVDPLRSLCANPLVSLDGIGIDSATLETAAARSSGRDVGDLLVSLREAGDAGTAEGLEALIDALDPTDATLEDYVENLRETLTDLGVEDAVDGYGSPDEATGSHRPAYEDSAWASVESVLSSLATIAPHVAGDDPAGRVQRALRAELVGGPDQQDGYVRVLPLAEAEMASVDHLFVLGLTSGYFPSEQDTMAFFGAVNDADEEFSRAHTGRRARYILGTLLTGSGEVTLSTPRHTVDGTEHVAAPVATELREYIAGGDEGTSAAGEPPLASAEDVQRAYAAWAGRERFDSPARAVDALGSADVLSADARSCAGRGLTAAWRRSRPELTAHDAQVEAVLDGVFPVGNREPYSPSTLEDYARCPFVFLAKNVLGFEEEYGDESGITRADRGTYVHDVLAVFFRELREAEHEPVDLERFDRLALEETLLDVALEHLDALGDVETPFGRRTVTRLLGGLGSPVDNPHYGYSDGDGTDGLFVRFLEEELDAADGSHARATYFEAGVGVDYDDVELLRDGAIDLDTPHGTVAVHGIADRVDVVTEATGGALPAGTRGIHVRDYKTGNTPARADVTLGTKLQLPLYGLALETVLEDATGIPHEALGGSYYRLTSPDDVKPLAAQVASQEAVGQSGGPPLVPSTYTYWELFDSREEFTRFVREVTSARVGKIATAVENGAFHPTLLAESRANCEDCTFRDACDVRHHLQRDTIEGLDESRHYVSERARETDLDLDAYATGGDD